jgi:phosphatidylinositol alpha-mannosyltransferase
VRLLVAGPGDADDVREAVPPSLRDRVELLGLVPEDVKPSVFASGTVYCAPHTHGESFGIVLVEAMATGTPVVASDLEAFRRVLLDGRAGVLVPVADPAALAAGLAQLLREPARRAALAERARAAVAPYDWSVVTAQILAVYETVAVTALPAAHVEVDTDLEVLADLLDDGGDEDDAGRVMTTLRRWVAERPRRDRSAARP